MPLKKKKAKTAVRKTPVRRKAKKPAAEFSPREVAAMEKQLLSHQESENAWQRLAAPSDEDDRWSQVEERMAGQPQRQDHAERRWKYFAK